MSVREYLYLDKGYLNSLLAQLGGGLMISNHQKTGSTENNEENKSIEKNGGVGNFLKLGVDLHKSASSGSKSGISNSTEEVIDSVLDDHAVQILQQHLEESTMLDPLDANEGDFINLSSSFKLYDFKFLSNVLSPDNMNILRRQDPTYKQIQSLKKTNEELSKVRNVPKNSINKEKLKNKELINELSKSENNSSWEIYETMYDVATFFNNSFPEIILIKADNSLIYCNRDFFRENSAQLSMLANSERKINIFGSVMSITKKRDENEEFEELPSDSLNIVPSILSTIMLSEFDMLDVDKTILIRPISVSFN